MNLLLLSDVYFPRVNGVSTSIRAGIEWLLREGHAVTLVAPDYGSTSGQARFDAEFGPALDVLRLPAQPLFFDPEDRLIETAPMRTALARLAIRHWDAVHVHTPFRAHQLGVRLRRRTGTPVVETYHTYFEQYAAHYLPWLPAPLLRAAARAASRHLCNAIDHMVVPTREMDAVLRRYGVRTPTTLLASGIEPGFEGGDGAAFRARHGIAPDRPVIATISRLAIEKNIGFLLEVAARLVRERPELLFVVAGEGPAATALQMQATRLGLRDNVRFFGNFDRVTLRDCYRAADAFVFASPTETQGLVLIEAMALGVPVVSTAVMGTATVLRDAQGALVAPEDVEGFARCVLQVLGDETLRARLAAAGPADAQRWRSDALMPPLLALYRHLAGGTVASN
ncbi:MAG: glycosyltransferase [Lysobacter sp.]|nr:glycosyltransferase [Lysobacter sp.]